MRKRKGFTLMELIIVVIIIAILAAIGLPQFFQAAGKAKVSKARSNLGEIRRVQLAFESVSGSWIAIAATQTVTLRVDVDNADNDNNHATGVDIQLTFYDNDYTYARGGDVITATPRDAGAGLPTNTMNLRTGVANW